MDKDGYCKNKNNFAYFDQLKMTFKNIMPFLKDNGIYYMEDVFPMDSLNIQEINNFFLKNSFK